MEKKYYDLVVLLIKEHKRYLGLEAILDDIVEDVYDHAKLVIDSVKDEEVVTNYCIITPNGKIMYLPAGSNSFKPAYAGVYEIRVLVYDKAGNIAMLQHKVNVVA